MLVKERPGSELNWKSYDRSGQLWFEASFDLMGFDVMKTSDDKIANTLRNLFKCACRLNSDFLSHWKKYSVETFLEFDLQWGLGSSSTLVYCLAQWAEVNPYHLLFDSFGGSGYDVACADAEGPILYKLGEDSLTVKSVDFQPKFKEKLYFVYLEKKQSSAEAIKHYYKKKHNLNGSIPEISGISKEIISNKSFTGFEALLNLHEQKMSKILGLESVQEELFPDFWGVVKSLGAWGGDFALVTSDKGKETTQAYFKEKGYSTFFNYDELIL